MDLLKRIGLKCSLLAATLGVSGVAMLGISTSSAWACGHNQTPTIAAFGNSPTYQMDSDGVCGYVSAEAVDSAGFPYAGYYSPNGTSWHLALTADLSTTSYTKLITGVGLTDYFYIESAEPFATTQPVRIAWS